jgi:hypothetical protein
MVARRTVAGGALFFTLPFVVVSSFVIRASSFWICHRNVTVNDLERALDTGR